MAAHQSVDTKKKGDAVKALSEVFRDPRLTKRDRENVVLGIRSVEAGKIDYFQWEKAGHTIEFGETAESKAQQDFNAKGRTIESDVRRLAKERGLWGKENSPSEELRGEINTVFDILEVPEPFRLGVLTNILDDIKDERAKLYRDRNAAMSELHDVKTKLEIFREIDIWTSEPLKLQRPDGSAFHKLVETIRSGAILVPAVENFPEKFNHSLDPVIHTFVINHDWAAAFQNATDFDGGEWRMPYEHTAFEYVLSGKRVILVVSEDEHRRSALLFVNLKVGWSMLTTIDLANGVAAAFDTEDHSFKKLASICMAQVRAIVIALEAEVAVSEIIRAPHKLNAARIKRGALPILDYHVVSLARRTRYERLPDPESPVEIEPRRHPRLHFVRGHWRHFPNHKTWIRWFLRGDPDLGFIEKEYRL